MPHVLFDGSWLSSLTSQCVLLCALAGVSGAGSPFAAAVVAYDAGANPVPGFTDPADALGSPARFTGVQYGFPSVVSPFSPPFDPGQIVSVGFGGSLTLALGRTARDDAGNPFGIDLIVFGNAGFIDFDWPNGDVSDSPEFFGAGARVLIEASGDGLAWSALDVRRLDLFPTLGYRDSGPYDTTPGSDPTSFTTAMDPSLTLADLAGLSYAELVGVYGRSGGGIGFDLSSAGLVEANYVRFSHAGFDDETFEIDAVAVVPSPAVLPLLCGLFGSWRTRRGRTAGALERGTGISGAVGRPRRGFDAPNGT